MAGLLLYFRYFRISVRSQLIYRSSFILQTIGHFLVTGIEFFGMWALFARFGNLRGWALPEVAFFYGTVNIAFAIADGLGRGFDLFSGFVKNGDFDRLLLRPRSTALQLLGHELTLRRVGRLTQGLVVLIWAASAGNVTWSAPVFLLLGLSICGAAALFLGLYVLQATLSFWTVETLEIMNTMTYGGVETAQYPLELYRGWFRKLFTYVVPLAAVTYYPLSLILERPGATLLTGWISPLAGFAFLLLTAPVWRFGVRHYTSTGS